MSFSCRQFTRRGGP